MAKQTKLTESFKRQARRNAPIVIPHPRDFYKNILLQGKKPNHREEHILPSAMSDPQNIVTDVLTPQSVDTNGNDECFCCQSKFNAVSDQLTRQKLKYEKLKKFCGEVLKSSAEKDLQISSLKLQQQLSGSSPVRQTVNLSEYRQQFTDEEVDELENISPEVKSDSSFVRKIIYYLYSDCELREVPTLRSRTKFEGGQRLMPNKDRTLVKSMLSTRLKTIEIPPFEYLSRVDKCSVHISRALSHLVCAKTNKY